MIASLIDNLFNRFLTHDEAVPLYGYVGRQPTSPDDRSPKIPQPNVERDINELVPVLSFKVGTETHSFTVQDLIRKAEVLGVSKDTASWLYSQGNNYSPPINFDRFTNFFNYYWVAKALANEPVHAWNPTLAPEYYVIARPKPTDLDKLNVVAASSTPVILTGTGFYTQTWVVEFTNDVPGRSFDVTATGAGISAQDATQSFVLPVVTEESTSTFQVNFIVAGANGPLLAFKVVRDPIYNGDGQWIGNESFEAGDSFSISAPFLSSSYTVSINQVSPGVKGKIVGVDSLDTYQTIGGVLVKENDRVLITGNGSDNGIYVVKPGAFVRAEDNQQEVDGSRVYVAGGVFAGYTFTSLGNIWNGEADTISNTNDWQESNYWMHRDEAAALGYETTKLIQATRPIIEFDSDLQLNKQYFVVSTPNVTLLRSAQVTNGTGLSTLPKAYPVDSGGVPYVQKKTEFNQAPLFDLFRYDGTHTGLVSPLFFYVEDPTADIDPALQRRCKHATNESGDFLFAHGLLDGDTLLFYKKPDGLHTIWHPGYSEAGVVDIAYAGHGSSTMTFEVLDPFTSQQVWTFTAIDSTTYEISASKIKDIPEAFKTITVGVPYSNGIFNALITGTTVVNDVITVRVGNFETTRYVYRADDSNTYDLLGGKLADTDGVGTWQIPRMFYNNVGADNGGELPEGTLYSHFRGVLQNQVHGLNEDRAFGGSIKLWSEQQNLLASLLMQRDMTPISIIDLAQRQYETALNSVTDIFMREFVQYLGNKEVIVSDLDVTEFVDYILSIRAQDNDVRTVLFDSTASVVGFPATLPMLGVSPLVKPGVVFDNELGATLYRHHDGHLSPLNSFSQDFRDRLFSPGMMIKRSDGSYTAAIGSFTTTPPAQPYKGELWMYPTPEGQVLRVFNVLSDGLVAPVATTVGDRWYDRASDLHYIWNGAYWIDDTNPGAAWVELDPASMLDEVIFEIENRLYEGANPEQRTYFSEAEVNNWVSGRLAPFLQRELATWAAGAGYDPLAPDYVSADPFTWNYSSLGMPARWFKALQAHQATISGVIPTSRPNLEPWKLLGFEEKPSNWDALYATTVTPEMVESGAYDNVVLARAVLFSDTPVGTSLFGLPTIDNRTLNSGDTVLLVSEAVPQNNGLWIVRAGSWERSSVALDAGLIVKITDGDARSDTMWVLTATRTSNMDPVLFEQVRWWKYGMWMTIKSARPGLKLSVDINRDILLPPYVNVSYPSSAEALTTTMPSFPSSPYAFGEGSPVETVWTKSIEFRYSLARALFRADPLGFLGYCWGFQWTEVDGILYDNFDITVPGHRRFRLHGDTIGTITRNNPLSLSSVITGPTSVDITITCDGYTAQRAQSFTVRTANGTLLGTLHEGAGFETVSNLGYDMSLMIEDEGKPFRVGDRFAIKANADGTSMTVVFEPASYARFNGFCQTFTQALRAASVDGKQGYAIQAYRGWGVNLGYRAGGLVSTDDLRVMTDRDTIPESAYALRFKRSPYAKDLWAQGLRITVVQLGSKKGSTEGGYVPTNDGADWVFRVEGYNSRYLGLEYMRFDTNGEYTTFNALSKEHTDREFKRYTDVIDTSSTQLPVTLSGLQNLITFLYGYSQKLEADGWRFQDDNGGNIDAATGRTRNWQLEIEKLIDRVYTGIDLGQGHVLVPFMDRIWLEQDVGLLSHYFDTTLFDVTGHPAVFDTLGNKIHTDDLTILRSRGKSMISANVPMFSVHAQVDEYEHLFVFNNLMSPSTGEGLIYDPFSGARIVTVKLNGRRQSAQTLRPEFGGHYLVGDEVKRNLQSSTDKVANYYDTDYVFEDELSTRHALALLGFSPKQYMSDLDLNDRSQFNFWRGLVQMKGTNASINAFLNNGRFEDAKLDEYWAYKVAEYGDSRSKVFPELKLTVDDALQQFTKLQFIHDVPHVDGHATYVSLEDIGFHQIDMGDEDRWYSLDDLDTEAGFEASVVGRYSRVFTSDEVPTQIKLDFVSDELDYAFNGALIDPVIGSADLKRLNATTLEVYSAGKVEVIGYGPATPKFNPVKLFNYVDSELINEIPVWHPAAGQHTPSAMESVNVISNIDPARYNVSTQVIGNANYDPLRSWGVKEVGRVWFDTTNLDYIPYYDSIIFPEVDGRLSRWGTLADYATVDVVEWVESTVPPSEYDTQSALDAGDADLNPYTKADGQVYGAKTYARDRVWMVRPIAWSKAGVATEAAHPSFNGSYNSTLNIESDGRVWLENGTFAEYGVVAGMRIGGWVQTSTDVYPTSEYLVTDQFTKLITGVSGSNVSIAAFKHTDVVGQLAFSWRTDQSDTVAADDSIVTTYTTYLVASTSDLSMTDVAVLRTDSTSTFTLSAPITSSYDLSEFGLRVTVTLNAGSYNVTANNASNPGVIVVDALYGIDIFDAVRVESIVPAIGQSFEAGEFEYYLLATGVTKTTTSGSSFPVSATTGDLFLKTGTDAGLYVRASSSWSLITWSDGAFIDKSSTYGRRLKLSNDSNAIGWRAWNVPTQDELDADSRVPNSSWLPYVGEFIEVSPTIEMVQEAANGASFTLNNGTVIERYATSWADWSQLKSVQFRQTASVDGALAITIPAVAADRVSVYVNGVAQLTGTYSISGTTLTVALVSQGSEVVVIVSAYSPTTKELEFDPSVEDDLLIQRQYKVDYQYVEVPVRGEDGMISTTKYYFWVKNRSTAARKKNLSVKSIAQLITVGPSQYLTFQNMYEVV